MVLNGELLSMMPNESESDRAINTVNSPPAFEGGLFRLKLVAELSGRSLTGLKSNDARAGWRLFAPSRMLSTWRLSRKWRSRKIKIVSMIPVAHENCINTGVVPYRFAYKRSLSQIIRH